MQLNRFEDIVWLPIITNSIVRLIKLCFDMLLLSSVLSTVWHQQRSSMLLNIS